MERVLSGAFAPGDRIDVNEIAAADGVSPTPVRNALYRLAGAGLLVSHSNEGFFVPHCSEQDLRDLYDGSSALLGIAIGRASHARAPPKREGLNAVRADECVEIRTEDAFREIMFLCANRRLCGAFADVALRLRPFRPLEEEWIANREAELRRILQAYETFEFSELGRLIDAYHRRRIRLAARIIARRQDRETRTAGDGAYVAGRNA